MTQGDPATGAGAEVELMAPEAPADPSDDIALVELVNRVIDRGVVVSGEVIVSVADVDLLYLGLRVLLASPDRLAEGKSTSGPEPDEAMEEATSAGCGE